MILALSTTGIMLRSHSRPQPLPPVPSKGEGTKACSSSFPNSIGYLKAVWLVFWGCMFEVLPAPEARECNQKCGGRSLPHSWRIYRTPGAGQISKNAPPKTRPDCLQALSTLGSISRINFLWHCGITHAAFIKPEPLATVPGQTLSRECLRVRAFGGPVPQKRCPHIRRAPPSTTVNSASVQPMQLGRDPRSDSLFQGRLVAHHP